MLVTIFPYSVLYINCKTDSSNNTKKYFPKFFDKIRERIGDCVGRTVSPRRRLRLRRQVSPTEAPVAELSSRSSSSPSLFHYSHGLCPCGFGVFGLVWIQLFAFYVCVFSFFFFFSRAGFVDFSTANSAFMYCSRIHKHNFSVTFY